MQDLSSDKPSLLLFCFIGEFKDLPVFAIRKAKKNTMIHCYKNNGYNIVLDVNSGSVHVVDEMVYDMIQLIEPLYEQGIKDADGG